MSHIRQYAIALVATCVLSSWLWTQDQHSDEAPPECFPEGTLRLLKAFKEEPSVRNGMRLFSDLDVSFEWQLLPPGDRIACLSFALEELQNIQPADAAVRRHVIAWLNQKKTKQIPYYRRLAEPIDVRLKILRGSVSLEKLRALQTLRREKHRFWLHFNEAAVWADRRELRIAALRAMVRLNRQILGTVRQILATQTDLSGEVAWALARESEARSKSVVVFEDDLKVLSHEGETLNPVRDFIDVWYPRGVRRDVDLVVYVTWDPTSQSSLLSINRVLRMVERAGATAERDALARVEIVLVCAAARYVLRPGQIVPDVVTSESSPPDCVESTVEFLTRSFRDRNDVVFGIVRPSDVERFSDQYGEMAFGERVFITAPGGRIRKMLVWQPGLRNVRDVVVDEVRRLRK